MNDILYLFNPWWENKDFFTGVQRRKYTSTVKKFLTNKLAIIFVGSRRVGKTILLHQIIKDLLKENVSPKKIIYLPLDHPAMETKTPLELIETARAIHGLKRNEKLFVFWDEVQGRKDWEKQAKAVIDFENIKLFLSGSVGALILTKEARLTGRTLTIVVRPLDFQEFADFRGFNFGRTDTGAREKLLDLFLQTGGYPEYVREQNPLYFADLVSNTIHKDIVLLFGIKNGLILRQALSLTADRVGAQTSYSKLGRVLSLSKDTVRDYLYYLSSTFLIGELKKFALSRNEQIYSPRKYYLTDNGLLFNLLGRFSAGAGAENAVFNKLSEGDWGFYYENQREIDFVNKDGDGYEVKYELSTENWEKFLRNVRGLSTEKFKKITLLTQQPRQEIVVGKIKIQCEKLSEFLFWN